MGLNIPILVKLYPKIEPRTRIPTSCETPPPGSSVVAQNKTITLFFCFLQSQSPVPDPALRAVIIAERERNTMAVKTGVDEVRAGEGVN